MHMRAADTAILLASAAALALWLGACSSETGDGGTGGTSAGGASSSGTGGGGASSSSSSSGDPTVDDDGDGYTEAQGDCNDGDPAVNPGATEICGDGVDNNCNGATDDNEPDGDGDGFGPCQGDCNDADPAVNPAATEVPGDNIDNNCDGITDADFDGDGYTEADGDCDDADPAVNPGASEDCYDGVDNDCNGFADGAEPDGDGDGLGPCEGDCNDADPNIGPGQPEIPNDGIDNNCDNLVDLDIDGDGWTTQNGDCNDADPTINPSVLEVCNDNIDNNCDGNVDTDCLTACELAELERSSVGCKYYAVDTNPLHSQVPGDYAVAVSNVDPNVTANVVIEEKNGNTWSTVPNGSFTVTPLNLHTTVLAHHYIPGSDISAGGAYRITSDLPVIAYQFNPLDGSSSYLSDASLLLPTSAYDKYFIVPAWPYGPADSSSSSGHPAHIQIVAAVATNVRVTSPIQTLAGGVPALQPNVQQQFSLAEGDFLQLTVKNFMDSFNGTYIDADDPVAVFTSNDCANVPAQGISACCCEHLEEQVYGLQTWGTTYVGARVPQRAGEGAVWQIMAAENNTTVSFGFNSQVTGLPPGVTLNARQMVEYEVGGPGSNPGDFIALADKPILVTQYMVGAYYAQYGSNQGDPSMMQAVPAEQFLSQYVVLVPNTWQNDFLVLTREQGSTVSIDGNPVNGGWVQVGSSNFEVARVQVADGVHSLSGSMPFGVTVIGYDAYDSYGYPGGLDQQIINPMN